MSAFLGAVFFADQIRRGRPSGLTKDEEPSEKNNRAIDELAQVIHETLKRERQGEAPDGFRELPTRWRLGSPPVGETAPPSRVGGLGDIANLFLELPDPRLIIMGEAGSGKTHLSRQLVRDLLARRRTDDAIPVPVPIPVSGWNPRTDTLASWFARFLRTAYGIAAPLATELVTAGTVLPVIDGLDELPAEMRAAAAAQLGRGGIAGRPVVVTCRPQNQVQLPTERFFRDAFTVELQPLHPGEVADYFVTLDGPVGDRWRAVARALRSNPQGPLGTLLATPLMVMLVTTAYATQGDPTELLDHDRFATEVDLETQIVDRSVGAVAAAGRHDGPGPAQSQRYWLVCLATMLTATGRTEFAWWHLAALAPSRVWNGWLRWLGLGGAITLSGILARDWRVVATAAAVVAMVMGSSLLARFPTPVSVAWPRGRVTWALLRDVAAGLLIGATLAILSSAGLSLPVTTDAILAKITTLALLGGAGMALLSISRHDAVGNTTSSQSKQSADRFAATVRATVVALFAGSSYQVWLTPGGWVGAGVLATAVFVVVLLDGSAWGQYTLARTWLAMRDQLPWRLDRFLREAKHAGVLRESDGRYEFRSALLRDRLAEEGEPGRMRAGRLAAAESTEISEELLALPETIAYVGSDPHGERREEVRQAVRETIAEHPYRVAEAGDEQYLRFQQARERMARAVGQPWWSRPVGAYRVLLFAALGIASWAFGLWTLPLMWTRTAARAIVPAAAVLLVLLLLQWLRSRRTLGYNRTRYALLLWTTLWSTAVIVVSYVSPELGSWPPVWHTAVAAAIIASLLALAWAAARPHADNAIGLRSDDPALWPRPEQDNRRYYEAAAQARRDWLSAIARDGVMPLIRSRLRRGRDQHTPRLPDLDPARLGGVVRSDQLVDTPASRRVAWLLRSLDRASIGVSGPRGAGKSTLLRRFCTAEFGGTAGDLLVLVPAPTAYDRQEFLVHLFAEVCGHITGTRPAAELERPVTRVQVVRLLPGIGLAMGIGITVSTLLWSGLTATAAAWQSSPRVPLLVAGVLLTGASTLWALWSVRRSGSMQRDASEAELVAARYLRMLTYQSSSLQTRSSRVTLPGGLEVGASGQLSRTELAPTYPELVGRFRGLLDLVSLERRGFGNRIVIGIDELDKMASPEEAERFINDLKAVFGIRGCHFLVAVSEEVLSTFDRRTMGTRAALDNAFDMIVPVSRLSLAEARSMLELRGVGLPEPFLWLCYALSGGLPRDLLRSVLALASMRGMSDLEMLPDLATELVRDDVRAVLPAQLHHTNLLAGTDGQAVTDWLATATETPVTAADLERVVCEAPSVGAGDGLAHLLTQTRAYLYYAATLVRVFAGSDAPTLDWLRGEAGDNSIDRMAAARVSLATQPKVALLSIQHVRNDSQGVLPLLEL
jgi:hypothetical protein